MQRRAFTVVELLVVMGVVMGIIAMLAVGLTAAARRARVANTEFLMNSIASALAQFQADVGYLPPVLGVPDEVESGASTTPFGTLGWGRDLIMPPTVANATNANAMWGNWSQNQIQSVQRYRSATTLAEYLLGMGDRSQDGYGVILDSNGALPATGTPGYREQPPLGIRHPGEDGVWGAKLNPRPGVSASEHGRFAARNLGLSTVAGNDPTTAQASPYIKGRQLGPYLELKDQEMIGGMVGMQADGTPLVAKPGQVQNFDLAPKVILDYFGKPIMYYRRGYAGADPRLPNRMAFSGSQTEERWTLADVFVLRPQRFLEGDAVNGLADDNNDPSTSRQLRSAEFALLSFGPDQRWNPDVRVDAAGYNADNIIRLGGQ